MFKMLLTQPHPQPDRTIWKSKVLLASGMFVGLVCLVLNSPAYAADDTEGLQLPADIAEKARTGPAPKYTIEERRINGRLDRITLRRDNGIDEVYDNTNANSLWQTEDEELGETQNLRRWTIGSW